MYGKKLTASKEYYGILTNSLYLQYGLFVYGVTFLGFRLLFSAIFSSLWLDFLFPQASGLALKLYFLVLPDLRPASM